MTMYELITKKKLGQALTTTEVNWLIENYTSGKIPDYQMSALLMAICLKGMTDQETTDLTMAMAMSGDTLDLTRNLGANTIDKHSTGGVGDKTTLIVAPIIAALGLPVAKMSGRGLGHTGGTVDKLESIPGFNTEMPTDTFLNIVKKHGICVTGQSGNMAPADKKIYALRDVTATVDSIPLIAASIMSKKIAAGAEHILLDVKTGSGAFMKDLPSAKKLAEAMVAIGKGCGRKTAALITDMSQPLGNAIGNSLEIKEVVQVLQNCENSPQDLVDVCVELSAEMLHLVDFGDMDFCRAKVKEVLANGQALDKFAEMVCAQGGDSSYVTSPEKFKTAKHIKEIYATETGYVREFDTEGVGIAALLLGAGRQTATDVIDYAAGIVLHAKIGTRVEKGEPIATLYTNKQETIQAAAEKFVSCVSFAETQPQLPNLIHQRV